MADPISDAVYAALQQMQAHPELRQAMAGVAGNTIPAQRIMGSSAPELGGGPQIFRMPGQTAREVAFEQPQATIGTHDGAGRNLYDPNQVAGFDPVSEESAGDSPVSTALRALTGAATGSATGTHDPADRGWLGRFLPEGVSNFAADVGVGMGQSDPRHPASMAFGEAFTGAQASNAARLDRKRADQRETKAEERQKMLDDIAADERAHDRDRERVDDIYRARTYAREEKQDKRAAEQADMAILAAKGGLKKLRFELDELQEKANDVGIPDDIANGYIKHAMSLVEEEAESTEMSEGDRTTLFYQYLNGMVQGWGRANGVEVPDMTVARAPDSPTTTVVPKTTSVVSPKTDAEAGTVGTSAGEAGDEAVTVEPAKPIVGLGTETNPLTIPPGIDPGEYLTKAAEKFGGKFYYTDEAGNLRRYKSPKAPK